MTLDEILASFDHDLTRRDDGLLAGRATLDGRQVDVIGVSGRAFVGVDEALWLSARVLDTVRRGGATPILVLLDSGSQRMSRRDELLGLNECLSHLAKSLMLASGRGHPTIGLLYGGTAAGAFIATALATRVLLALPPSMGKRRIGVVAPVEAIVSSEAPPALAALRDAAPEAWRVTLDALDALARRHRVGCRAFGSLAWQALTGLTYLSAGSDLDVLFELPAGRPDAGSSGSAGGREALAALLDGIAACDAAAPMRIDGELIRADGAGANWREWHAARGEHDEIVVKTAAEVVLMTPRAFLEGAV